VTGLDKATAQKILKVWEETGAGSSPDALRKMLINRSIRTLGTVLLQVGLDTGPPSALPAPPCSSLRQPISRVLIIRPAVHAGASWGAFTTARYIASGGDFFGKIAVEYLAYALGLYFGVGAPSHTLGCVGCQRRRRRH